jgi:hypothetical protein
VADQSDAIASTANSEKKSKRIWKKRVADLVESGMREASPKLLLWSQ